MLSFFIQSNTLNFYEYITKFDELPVQSQDIVLNYSKVKLKMNSEKFNSKMRLPEKSNVAYINKTELFNNLLSTETFWEARNEISLFCDY